MDDQRASADRDVTPAGRPPPIDLDAGRTFRDVITDLNKRLKTEIKQSGEDGFDWDHYLPIAQQSCRDTGAGSPSTPSRAAARAPGSTST